MLGAAGAIVAFDLAAKDLLEQDFTEGVEQNANEVSRRVVMILRVLFMDEIARLDAPRPQARPS